MKRIIFLLAGVAAAFATHGHLQTATPSTGSDAILPFHVNVPQPALDDLRQRVLATRWPDKETVNDESQGIRSAEMEVLLRYWGNGYNWRNAEAKRMRCRSS